MLKHAGSSEVRGSRVHARGPPTDRQSRVRGQVCPLMTRNLHALARNARSLMRLSASGDHWHREERTGQNWFKPMWTTS